MRRLAVLAVICAPAMVQAQTDDRGYLTAFLEDNLSGAGRQVTITGFEGALSSQAKIAQLQIADDQGVWITLNDVTLDWSRAALLRGAVSVNGLTAGEIILERPPILAQSALPDPEARGFALPDLPVSVDIGLVAAERIVLGQTVLGTALEGRLAASLSLNDGAGNAKLLLERTDDGPAALLDLAVAYSNDDRNLVIDLTATEDAGGIATSLLGIPGAPAIALSITGDDVIDDFTADLQLASDGVDRLAGTVSVQKIAEGQHFAADLKGDLAPLFVPEYAAFFGPDVALHAEGISEPSGRLNLQALAVTTRALAINGSFVRAADGLPERFDLTAALGSPDGAAVVLPFGGPGTAVERADITLSYDVTKGEGWRGQAVVAGLDRADFAADRLDLQGSGRISRSAGGAAAPVIGANFSYAATGLAATDAAMAAALGRDITGEATLFWQPGNLSLNIPKLTVLGDDYALEARGRMENPASGIDLSGRLLASVQDASRFSALAGRPLSGAAQAEVAGSVNVLGGGFDLDGTVAGTDLTVGLGEVDNLLRGASQIAFSALRDGSGTRLRDLTVAAGSLTAKASGTVATAGSDLVAYLNFADLAVLGGGYRGALVGKATFTGTQDAGVVTLNADGTALAIGIPEVDALLRGPSKVILQAGLRGDVIDLKQLSVNAATLDLGATGTVSATGSDVAADLNFRDLTALGGGYRGALAAKATFKGTPAKAAITLDGTGRGLAIGQVETDKLLAGNSRVAAALELDGGRIRIDRATLTNPQVTASATGAIAGNRRQVGLTARLANLGLLLPDFPGAVTVQGTAVEDAQGYQINLTGKGPGQIDARVQGRLAAGLRTARLTMTGSAQAGLANVFVTPRQVSGPLRFDLTLNGPLALASLRGRVSLAAGRVSDPTLPFVLEGVEATADLTGGRANVAATAALSTGGTVAVTGTVGLSAPMVADLDATLTQVKLKDPQLYETRLNGTVQLRGPLTGGARISGDILLNETELRIPSTGFGGAGGLPGLQHVNEPADVRATRVRAGLIPKAGAVAAGGGARAFALDLRVRAPNRMFLRGRGLDAELGGEVRLGGTTAAVAPSGAFRLIRGRLDILGKRLVLSEAELVLQGDFDPFVRILASNESDGITSSVLIEGSASEPTVSFVSSPELPEEEVLARLLFGRGLTSLSAFQAVQLASAVATLAGRGGEGIVGKLRQGFGLDDLDLSTNPEGDTTLKAGKYLSKNVYTEVEVDQNGQSQINLNLDVSDSVTIRGSTGTGGNTGIGIFIEKDY